jgi:hypothetical protein
MSVARPWPRVVNVVAALLDDRPCGWRGIRGCLWAIAALPSMTLVARNGVARSIPQPEHMQAFFERWITAIPTPLRAEDRAAGYWWDLSMRQTEV